ncbi:MAG TPA: LuxR C-terminal-related transcriptional regulator [Actinomycetota bacterium]|nr:LuxR C-terminal-related transcriptional regulator [Actinomycetota bacterium]
MDTVADAVRRGEDALDEGQWQAAREAFEAALAGLSDTSEGVAVTPPGAVVAEAEEGLARALWWLHDFEAAVGHMERAYAAFRAAGDETSAARSARWLAREHAAAFGNAAASSGWYARAEGLIGAADDPERGWLALARAERASGPDEIARNAADALASARSQRDSDLEAAALVRLGYADVASGDVVAGMAKIDEAMAAATGGDVRGLETIGDVICVGISACEHAADWQRIEQWGQVVERWLSQHEHVAVLGFCYACCAEMFVASGQWEMAEGLLVDGLRAMQEAKLRARCVHPAAKLAELRLLQGRLEEAEQLLAGFESLPESTHALAMLYLAKGDVAIAAAVLHRRLNAVGDDNVLAAPFLALLVDVRLAQGDIDGAGETARRLEAVARQSSLPRLDAMSSYAVGRVANAAGATEDAIKQFAAAIDAFSEQGMALDAARSRFELARTLDRTDPEVAVGEARVALAEFERLGAPRDADAAAAFLRDHGVAGRTGPKKLGLLSRREREVLALLGEGLTNAEIAARLFISTKTAGNHVSNILGKLNLRGRSEAAAYAIRHIPGNRSEE